MSADGLFDFNRGWVTSYNLHFYVGTDYKVERDERGSEVTFSGNFNADDRIEHCINSMSADRVKFVPRTWEYQIGLRWNLYIAP